MTSLIEAAPRPLKRAGRRAYMRMGVMTAPLRLQPAFLMIGAQRCGTTSLQQYLDAHPLVSSARFTKGTHFFDRDYPRGVDWYRSHFPTSTAQNLRRIQRHGLPMLTGESCSYYIFHPLALERIAETLPRARIIVMLRDPVSRAYSQYNHEVARGFETLSFEEALEREAERLAGEAERMVADPGYDSHSYRHHSYALRGHYVDQLQRLYSLFPEDQVLLLESGRLFADPDTAFGRVLAFLQLPKLHLPGYERCYAYQYPKLDRHVRARLAERFAGPNQLLFDYLDTALDWTRP